MAAMKHAVLCQNDKVEPVVAALWPRPKLPQLELVMAFVQDELRLGSRV